MRLIAFGDSNAAAKSDAAALEFALAETDSFIRIRRRKQAFLLLSSDITALECPI